MPVLKLSDVAARDSKKPNLSLFLNQFHDQQNDWRERKITRSLFYRTTDIPDCDLYHTNYMTYLEHCWNQHHSIVVTPDILWYTLMTEFSGVVKETPEEYRALFSKSDEKQKIVVESGSMVVMPLDALVAALKMHVPTDVDTFLPNFSTSTDRSRHAMYATFCDTCSPFYDYCMTLCNFPAIDIRGELNDWTYLADSWKKIGFLCIDQREWVDRVQNILDNCVNNFSKAEWWRNIFEVHSCGSGHRPINGWYSNLFRKQPRTRNIDNFPSCLAVVNYEQLESKKNYRMRDGLLFSRREDDFMVPDFGYMIHEVIKVEPETYEEHKYHEGSERFQEKIKAYECNV